MSDLLILAGPRARALIARDGLQAAQIAAIPAAAGGPKGLILSALDRWLFSTWLPGAPRERSLIGASIGAWRMAAACFPDADAGLAELAQHYCAQHYSAKPDQQEVTHKVKQLLTDWVGPQAQAICQHPHYRLHILAVRGLRALQYAQERSAQRGAFGAAALANLGSRRALARHLERVLISDARDDLSWLGWQRGFDAFHNQRVTLTPENLRQALLASGTLPLIMQAVPDIAGAAPGLYWDGGMIDYHLAWPWQGLGADELVLYPHFTTQVTPGWFDKILPWRRHLPAAQRAWLENMVLLAPGPDFVRRLPRRKLPDRKDFQFHGQNHLARARDWQRAIDEAQALRDALMEFIARPDPKRLLPL
ncbi:patatin-like phospholipase family protein [Massilia sp. W12]|uniref:patatin-like phospholipase family protein n=1 Tax=Massilia sp. W12 TaxID=3126507 RepID=UPI0030D2A68F